MVTLIPARLNLGFAAGYMPDPANPNDPKKHVKTGMLYKGWDLSTRNNLKYGVQNSLYSKTTPACRIAWQSVILSIASSNPNEIKESEVKNCIKTELARTTSETWTISITTDDSGNELPVEDITYIWYEGQRYCQHNYGVSYELTGAGVPPTPWWVDSYPKPAQDEPARILAVLSWATAI